jgi:hypothetical protein
MNIYQYCKMYSCTCFCLDKMHFCYHYTIRTYISYLDMQKCALKVVGIEKLGGLGVCILIEKGTGPW